VAQLYPQALGSLFVASYDSHGYGEGIRIALHTGFEGAKNVPQEQRKSGRLIFKVETSSFIPRPLMEVESLLLFRKTPSLNIVLK
jgi:hypothetical protein